MVSSIPMKKHSEIEKFCCKRDCSRPQKRQLLFLMLTPTHTHTHTLELDSPREICMCIHIHIHIWLLYFLADNFIFSVHILLFLCIYLYFLKYGITLNLKHIHLVTDRARSFSNFLAYVLPPLMLCCQSWIFMFVLRIQSLILVHA